MKHDSCDEKRREGTREKRERERVKMKCVIITELSDVVSNMMLNYCIYKVNKNVVQYI